MVNLGKRWTKNFGVVQMYRNIFFFFEWMNGIRRKSIYHKMFNVPGKLLLLHFEFI